MNEDLKELLKLLNVHGVEYVIIGAHALAFYGHPRFTEDIDLFLNRSLENAQRLATVLEEFGLPMAAPAEHFTQDRKMVRLGLPPNRIDLLNFGPEIPFEEVYSRRVQGEIGGVEVAFISLQDLIRSKQDSGRPKDLLDLHELGVLPENN